MLQAPKSRETTRAAYDRMSRWYDLLAGPSEWGCVEAGLRELAVGEGEAVLEVGFGTGRALAALARSAGVSGRAYGVDLSPRMCRAAWARAGAAGLSARVQVVRGDVVYLPFPSGCLDAVFMSFALELFAEPEIPVVLAECKRVLREDGRLGVVAMSREEPAGLPVRLYERLHQALPKWVDCRPISPPRVLADAGFAVLRTMPMAVWGLPVVVVVASRQ